MLALVGVVSRQINRVDEVYERFVEHNELGGGAIMTSHAMVVEQWPRAPAMPRRSDVNAGFSAAQASFHKMTAAAYVNHDCHELIGHPG